MIRAAEAVAAARAVGRDARPGLALESLSALNRIELCASLAYDMLEARVRGDATAAARLEGELVAGQCDAAWATTIVEYLKYFGPGGSPREPIYVTPADAGEGAIAIKPGARIALLSDWGTGADPARRLLSAIKAQSPDVIVHLGDIYYSGTPKECATKFEAMIEEAFGPIGSRPPVFTMSGNHDMYCGGEGYYGLIDRLNTGARKQRASFFCLRAEDDGVQILAMDTGRHDYSPLSVTEAVTFVDAAEERWLGRRLAEFTGRTVLLSHHQLFSAFSQIGSKSSSGRLDPVNRKLKSLYDGFGPNRSRIAAWLWGHEHNLCIYAPYADLAKGRCIGHGAIPVSEAERPYDTLTGVATPPVLMEGTRLSIADGYYRNGFAMLTAGPGAAGRIDYFEVRGSVADLQYSETL